MIDIRDILKIMMPILSVFFIYSIIMSIIGIINIIGIRKIFFSISKLTRLKTVKFRQDVLMTCLTIGSYILVHMIVLTSFHMMILIALLWFFFTLFIPIGIVTSLVFLKSFTQIGINKSRLALLWMSTTVPIVDLIIIKLMKHKMNL